MKKKKKTIVFVKSLWKVFSGMLYTFYIKIIDALSSAKTMFICSVKYSQESHYQDEDYFNFFLKSILLTGY